MAGVSENEGRFGIYFPANETIMTDSNMNSVADAMRAVHGYGLESPSQFGVLVEKVEGEWQLYVASFDVAKYAYSYHDPVREEGVGTCAEEFERLRRMGPKWSLAQQKRIGHLEMHLDNGDILCRCYKEEIT